MKVTTTFRRLKPDTLNGDSVAVTTVYSSFNRSEIDSLEETLERTIGFCVVQEFGEERRTDGEEIH